MTAANQPPDPPPSRNVKPAIDDCMLLALTLGSSPDAPDTNPDLQAIQLLDRFSSLPQLAAAAPESLVQAAGLSEEQIKRLLAAWELGRRRSLAEPSDRPFIQRSEDAVALLEKIFQGQTQETFQVILLNARRQVISLEQIYQGNVSRSILRACEVYRPAVLRNAPFLLAAHNHPSGDPEPSRQDIITTDQLYQAGQLLNIELLDHLVLGRPGRWTSMREQGLGFPPEPTQAKP